MTGTPRGDDGLLDFGRGRRLERFGGFVIDRPAPGTERVPQQHRELWQVVGARYDGDRATAGQWTDVSPQLAAQAAAGEWRLAAETFSLQLRLAPSGQLGVFPEQSENWRWIHERSTAFHAARQTPLRVLNLFAYTGGSTLAAASAGAEVAHVDASGSVVKWARENAARSQMAEAPIRWLVEDAGKFVQRELRRGSPYDAVILDPPSFGRGRGKVAWKIETDLPDLLAMCAELTGGEPEFLLLTAHTPEFEGAFLRELVSSAGFPTHSAAWQVSNAPLTLQPAGDSRHFACGHSLRLWRK